MNALRDHILSALKGSSSQQQVSYTALQKACENDPGLNELLNKLQDERIVNSVTGVKDGKSYENYWLTGAAMLPPPAFRVNPLAPRPQQTAAKVQPNTSIPTQEQPMEKKTTGITANVLEILNAQPGIKFQHLFGAMKNRIPALTEKKLKDNLLQMGYAQKIEAKGEGEARTYHLGSNAEKMRGPAKTKTSPPPKAKKSCPAKASKPAPAAALAAPGSGYQFGIMPQEDGGCIIHKNGLSLTLAKHEVQACLENM